MTTLAEWLHQQVEERQLTQQAAIDYFEIPREYVVRLAARMPIEHRQSAKVDGCLVEELLYEFRKLPDNWKPKVKPACSSVWPTILPPASSPTTQHPLPQNRSAAVKTPDLRHPALPTTRPRHRLTSSTFRTVQGLGGQAIDRQSSIRSIQKKERA